MYKFYYYNNIIFQLIKSMSVVNEGFYYLHTLFGILLIPVRFSLSIIIIIFIALFAHLCNILKISTTTYLGYSYKLLRMVTYLFGFNIKVKNNESYNKFKNLSKKRNDYIIALNHISPFELLIVPEILKINYTTVAFSNAITKSFPFNIIFKMADVIICYEKKRNSTVDKIKEHVVKNKIPIAVSPDSCRKIPNKQLIAPFKTGIFATKCDILPLVIRYVPSSLEKVNHESSNNIVNILLSFLRDGHFDIYASFLDLQNYDENKYKNISEYRDDVYNKMTEELKKLPQQKPNALENLEKTNVRHVKTIILGFGILFLLGLFQKQYLESASSLLLLFTGFLHQSFKTNNTRDFDILSVGIILFYYLHLQKNKKTESTLLQKLIVLFIFTNTIYQNYYTN